MLQQRLSDWRDGRTDRRIGELRAEPPRLGIAVTVFKCCFRRVEGRAVSPEMAVDELGTMAVGRVRNVEVLRRQQAQDQHAEHRQECHHEPDAATEHAAIMGCGQREVNLADSDAGGPASTET